MLNLYDVIIIGAGPAGLTAGIYCGRSKLRTKIIDQAQAGGLVNLTDEIENYPGLLKTEARSLIKNMRQQIKDLPCVELEEFKGAREISYETNQIKVETESFIDGNKTEYISKSLIISTGASPKKLGVKGEDEFIGKGVSYCAVCDGPFFTDKDVVLIGGGDTAIQEALYLTKFARIVKIIHRRDSFRAGGLLLERAGNNPKIELVLDSTATEILGNNFVEGLRVKNVKTLKEYVINCQGVFIFVGYTPNTDFVKGIINLDEDKYIVTDERMFTNKKGVFACGDCRRRPFKQIVTACGDAAVAAHEAEKYLNSEGR